MFHEPSGSTCHSQITWIITIPSNVALSLSLLTGSESRFSPLSAGNGGRKEKKLLTPAEAGWPTSSSRMKHVYFMKVTLDEFQVEQHLFKRTAVPNRNSQLRSRSTQSSWPLYSVDLQVPWSPLLCPQWILNCRKMSRCPWHLQAFKNPLIPQTSKAY